MTLEAEVEPVWAYDPLAEALGFQTAYEERVWRDEADLLGPEPDPAELWRPLSA